MNDLEQELDKLFEAAIRAINESGSYGRPRVRAAYKEAYRPEGPAVELEAGCFRKLPARTDGV